MQRKRNRTQKKLLPGFGLSMGYTLVYLSLVVLIPLSSLLFQTFSLSWHELWNTVLAERVLLSYRLSFGAAFAAAMVNTVFGLIIAWVLTRYEFVGKRLLDGLIDLPFALPTAVAGITLAALYSPNGLLGQMLAPLGITIAYTPLGIVVALLFIGLPFVVRTVQPVLQDVNLQLEEAAESLGATKLQIFGKVILPQLLPSLLTGFTLAFARGLGEYGSVVFISGNMPNKTEIAPLLIMTKLEQFDYAGATAIALTMLIISFVLILVTNLLQWQTNRKLLG